MVKSPDRRALMPSVGLVVKLGFLVWMLGIMFLEWLMYWGLGLGFIGRQLGILQLILRAQEFLRQFFTASHVF